MLKNPIFKMVTTLVVIAVIVAAAMSYVNKITEPLIAQNNIKILNESLKKVLPADEYKEVKNENAQVYIASKDGKQVGVCVVATVVGYGGDVKVLTGVDKDNKVTNIRVLSHSETPGLGANASKEQFTNKFIGKSGELTVTKTAPKDNEIEAMAGATITSRAVTNAVNTALKIAKENN